MSMVDLREDASATRWATVEETIRSRRSNLNVDLQREVPRHVVERLLGLAVTAPNHYRTNPWRFAVVTGDARVRLGNVVAEVAAAKPDAKEAVVERQRVQFLRAPTVVVAASATDPDPIKQAENKHAVAAGVQNILLGATAMGLASAWRSGPPMIDPDTTARVKEEIGLEPTDEIVSFIYLGYPIGAPGSKEAPTPSIRFVEQ
jgi:nitroreductase